MSLNTHGLERKDYIIYYDWQIGGYTVDEWLIHWTWLYFINSVNVIEYMERIDYITAEMPGALDSNRWQPFYDYMERIREQDAYSHGNSVRSR